MSHISIQSISGPVYLDANFLVAYFVKNHSNYKTSRQLFFYLVASKIIMYISNLGLDETLMKIYETYQQQTQKTFPFNYYADKFENVLKEIVEPSSPFRLIQFSDPVSGAKKAVSNIKQFNLRPRDAFHHAHMQDLGISQIVTKNKKDFEKIPGISLISF
ncbi:type II toxin-antitoxin system VapC family toxin [Patescibacteria group bacterium]|nr:type II toxin-antitoxin system VapC family toxin [Patescibacteria group bacterium]